MRLSSFLVALLVLGCGSGSDGFDPDDLPEQPGQPGPAPSEEPSEEPAEEPEPPEVVTECEPGDPTCFDCSAASNAPLSKTVLTGPVGYHGIAIDNEGFMIGAEVATPFYRSDYAGNSNIFLHQSDYLWPLEQMTYLPDGDLAVAAHSGDGGPIIRITPAGGIGVIATDAFAYGLILGLDGMLYTGSGVVYRIDPSTGNKEALVEQAGAHALAFSQDSSRLYIGGYEKIFKVDLDADLNPTEDPQLVTEIGEGNVDSLVVDACGNLYLTTVFADYLYRVSPSGEISEYIYYENQEIGENLYAHGSIWGTGVGGWRTDAIYAPMPRADNRVMEIVTGVPGRHWQGTVINAH